MDNSTPGNGLVKTALVGGAIGFVAGAVLACVPMYLVARVGGKHTVVT